MKRTALLLSVSLPCAAISLALAQPPKETKPAKQPEIKAPAGWTDADMQACMEAGMPGEKHAILARSIGTWRGKSSMWMTPGSEPMTSECTMVVTDFMDGRFTKWEMAGDIPGMGAMKGMGLYGFDNLANKYVATWVTNCGTNIMNGTGELSSDGKTFTWTYTMIDPISKKPATMRDIERHTAADTIVLETWGTDPKSGKDYRIMEATLNRTAKTAGAIQKVSARTVEVACASCVYHMDGETKCKPAVKIDGKTYLMDGAKVPGHDWCEKTLNATVDGSVENGRFVATSLTLK